VSGTAQIRALTIKLQIFKKDSRENFATIFIIHHIVWTIFTQLHYNSMILAYMGKSTVAPIFTKIWPRDELIRAYGHGGGR
jgi:hypothetical protein